MMNIPSLFHKFCDAVWEYDTETNEVYFHYDRMNPELCGQLISYDTVEKMYRETYVHPLDMELWNRLLTPEGFKRFIEGNLQEEHFYIRFIHTKKEFEWHEVFLQRTESNRLLLVSQDVKEIQRNAAIAKAVVPEYDYVACIDVASQSYVMYYSEENKTVVPKSISDNYDRVMEEYHRAYVVPEDADILTEQMRMEHVIKELEEKGEYILYTTLKEGERLSYKKLRFSYESEAKDKLLLTRLDIGELIGERKLREKEREKRLQYLQHMPVAFCSIRVLVDETGKPYDFQFTYSNRANDELNGVKEGELLGKNFYEVFQNADPKWLAYYYETAYKGVSHVIRKYSPEIGKHLLVYTFQMETGCCECVLLDVSEQYFLTQELEQSREDLRRILETTTSFVFQYSPKSGDVTMVETGQEIPERVPLEGLHQILTEKEWLDSGYWKIIEDAFLQMKSGEHSVSAVIRGRLRADDRWNWYRMTMFDFWDGYTHERRILGFLQNIDEDKTREEELKKKAQIDPLTGVYNREAGKQEICKKLKRKQYTNASHHAMFIIDLDDFKNINDSNGHMMGDSVLKEFAQVLRRTFRKEDVIYRLGGDEFVVFVGKIHEPDQDIGAMMHRFHLRMKQARVEYPFLYCSVGIFVTNRCYSFEKCYEMADGALYETKNGNKGFYTVKKDDGGNV